MNYLLQSTWIVLIGVLITAASPSTLSAAQDQTAKLKQSINVHDYQDHVEGGDWSRAIQAAIDYVDERNGFTRGAVIYFPPGKYRVDQTIVVGKKPAHWGIQLLGHGAILIGSKTLDERSQEAEWAEQDKKLKGNKLIAFEDDKGLGPAILEVHNPPEYEGAGITIEGLTFDREQARHGIGIKIALQHPKVTTLRSVRVFNQDIGVHVNYAWQIYFNECLFRSNRVGVLGQNHFNAISFVNCTFRRNHHHGLQIGPNRGQWGSSAVNATGCIFESNKGYGLYNAGGVQVVVTGGYFEANGNSIGIETPFGHTTVDTCFFWGTYPAKWNIVPHAGKGHIVINGTRNVQLRNNRYGKGDGILITGQLDGSLNRFDTSPVVYEGVSLPDSLYVASDDGLTYYDYDPKAHSFQQKTLRSDTGHVIQHDNVDQDGG